MKTAIVGLLLIFASACAPKPDPLRLSWQKEILTISSERLPAGKVEILHLEAFCRRGSTDRDWHDTVVPHKSELIAADPAGHWLKLKTTVAGGKVEVMQDIRSTHDEVDFQLQLTNKSAEPVDIDWAQPCIRVGAFSGRSQGDYYERCFIFTDRGLTLMSQTDRQSRARYVPGQVYVPEGIDLNDVNPRPISKTRPVNGLVGCFSGDDRLILAAAWDQTQELFQGVIVCIHADFRIGGLRPGQTKNIHGKIYIVPNDINKLLKRYRRDFGPRVSAVAA
jgi:hypothetical protein